MKSNSLLVTGASGLVGTCFLREWVSKDDPSPIFAVHQHQDIQIQDQNITPLKLNLLDEKAVHAKLSEIQPEVILHLAKSPKFYNKGEQEYSDNEEMLHHLKSWCLRKPPEQSPYFIFASTDMVYDGKKSSLYREDVEEPHPLQPYGASKLRCEKLVNELPHSVILRISLVYSFDPIDTWTETILNTARSGDSLNCFIDEIRSQVHAEDLAYALRTVINKRPAGIFHIAGDEPLSRYEYALTVLERYKLSSSCLVKCKQQEVAPHRPTTLFLSIEKLKRLLGNYDFKRLRPSVSP